MLRNLPGNAAPRSRCICGHTGDGAHSEHSDFITTQRAPGHGHCTVDGCMCFQFSWRNFLADEKARDKK